jgi:flagellar M-ring protein FliF
VEGDLLTKINSTLEPLLGADKFRANVSVECDFSGGELSEEVFDPEHSVMSTSQRTEDSSGGATASGVPGTASTLPRPTSRPATGSSRVTRSSENIAYQTSRTVKKTRMPAGVVKKMSLAVLVDQSVSWEKDGKSFKKVLVPPTADTMKIIHDVVAGATGLNEDRGDQLVIETLPFESTLQLEPPAVPGTSAPVAPMGIVGIPVQLNRNMLMIGGGAAAGVIVIGFLLAMLLRKRKKKKAVAVSSAAELAAGDTPAARAALAAAEAQRGLEEQLAERDSLQQKSDAQVLTNLKLAPVITKKAEVMAKHLRERISKEPEISAHILRTWIREEDQ